ncbi:MAG: hypothetical protein QXR97_06120 [Thermoproteota archaeon]
MIKDSEKVRCRYGSKKFELCLNYDEIVGFWFDGWWNKPNADWRLGELYDMIHSLQPSAFASTISFDR